MRNEKNIQFEMVVLTVLLLTKVVFGGDPVPPRKIIVYPPGYPPEFIGEVQPTRNGNGILLPNGWRIMPQPAWDKPGAPSFINPDGTTRPTGQNVYPHGYMKPPNSNQHIPINGPAFGGVAWQWPKPGVPPREFINTLDLANVVDRSPWVLTGVGYGMNALMGAVEHMNTDPMQATAEATVGTYVLIGAGGLVYAPIVTVAAPAAAVVGVVGASATTGYMLGQSVAEGATGGDLDPLQDAVEQIKVPDKEASCSERANFLSDIHGALCNTSGRQNWVSRDCMNCCETSFQQVSSGQQIQNACPSDTDLSRSGALYESFMNQCNQKCNL